jgi:O-antigen/teichoic acid export membrane protein
MEFAENVLKMSGGAIISQGATIIASPIITRLYGPEAFGNFALFTTIVSIISVVVCMRYECSILLPATDSEAGNLLTISLLFTGFISIASGVIVLIMLLLFETPSSLSGIDPYIWLIPVGVFFSGTFVALFNWNSRRKRFGHLSIVQISRSLVYTGTQLGAGIFGFIGGGSLIIASILSSFVSTVILGINIWKNDLDTILRSVSWIAIKKGLRRYSNFPIYDLWAALLTTMSNQLPVLLLAVYFSSTIVGYYALGMIMLQFPMALIGTAVGQVFWQKAAEARHEGKEQLTSVVAGTFTRLTIYGLYPFLLLFLFGQDLFQVAFGYQWAEAGLYAQILYPYIFLNFIASPISSLFNILEGQRDSLLINIIYIILRSGALIAGGILGDPRWCIFFFSIMSVAGTGTATMWFLTKAEVSLRKIIAHIRKYLVYSLLFSGILIFLKYRIVFSPTLMILIAGITTFPYFVMVIHNDEMLKALIRKIKTKLSHKMDWFLLGKYP